jgi:hypothetical protein
MTLGRTGLVWKAYFGDCEWYGSRTSATHAAREASLPTYRIDYATAT